MTVAILITFFFLALAVDWQLERRKSQRATSTGRLEIQGFPKLTGLPAADRAAVLSRLLPASGAKEVLHHPGHAWMRIGEDNLVAIGADEITGKLLGSIDSVELPAPGDFLAQGAPAWTLSHRGRFLNQLSPVSGEVVELNTTAQEQPKLINRAPYGRGWLLKIKPTSLSEDIQNVFSGSLAEAWLTLSKERINAALAPLDAAVQSTAQDGGELLEELGDQMSDEQWKAISAQLFGGR